MNTATIEAMGNSTRKGARNKTTLATNSRTIASQDSD